jgi:ATP-dependent helicase HrpB
VEGQRWGQPERVALAAALLSERDPFSRPLDERRPAGPAHPTSSDVLDRIDVLEEFERHGRYAGPLGTLNRGAAHFVLRARDQLLRSLRQDARRAGVHVAALAAPVPAEEAILRAVLAAFPDRLARRREAGSPRGVMVGGRGVRLAPSSGVTQPELFVCVEVDAGQAEALVRQASLARREWLPAEQVHVSVDAGFDPTAERVLARRRLRFEDLVLEETTAALPDEAETARVLAAAAAANLERVLPDADSSAGLYLTRVRCLGQWLPELGLPAFDEDQLRALLPGLCAGCRSFEDLREVGWLGAIQATLTHPQRQAVATEAPERLEVPSGSHIALRYEVGRPPVLAVRIQEVFGLRETPRIARGRVRVLLHLLAPNYRPQQVTDDLASFWANTYPQVRRELRARYPKHAWPEDPLSAPPERRPRRRG